MWNPASSYFFCTTRFIYTSPSSIQSTTAAADRPGESLQQLETINYDDVLGDKECKVQRQTEPIKPKATANCKDPLIKAAHAHVQKKSHPVQSVCPGLVPRCTSWSLGPLSIHYGIPISYLTRYLDTCCLNVNGYKRCWEVRSAEAF